MHSKTNLSTEFFLQQEDSADFKILSFTSGNVFAYAHVSVLQVQDFNANLKLLTHPKNQTPQHVAAIIKKLDPQVFAIFIQHLGHESVIATHGDGVIYCKKADSFNKLLSQNVVAKGNIDFSSLVLTTNSFATQVGGEEGVSYYFGAYTPHDLAQILTGFEKTHNLFGFLAITQNVQAFESPVEAQVTHEPQAELQHQVTLQNNQKTDVSVATPTIATSVQSAQVDEEVEVAITQDVVSSKGNIVTNVLETVSKIKFTKNLGAAKAKIFNKYVLAAIVLIVVVATFLLKDKFKITNPFTAKSTAESALIKAVAADEASAKQIAALDVLQAAKYLSQANLELQNFKTKYGQNNATYKDLNLSLQTQKKQILNIKDAKLAEHFDLELDSSDAHITDTFYDSGNIYILDGDIGVIYIIKQDVRAFNKIESQKLKKCTRVAAILQSIYVLCPQDGVYLVAADSNNLVLQADPKWGAPQDLQVFNTNIYVLDQENRTIYKYQGQDERTFGSSLAYLADYEEPSFADAAESITIDGSLYVLTKDKIYKYFGGQRAEFKPNYPSVDVNFTGLYTNEDLDKIFLLNSKDSLVYAMGKDGKYLYSLQSDTFKTSKLVGATKENLIILRGTKIFKVGL